ncbi:glycoside hydrolase family 31 protein [Fulvivirgaceae bacterium BMA10]|uniref:Glycoside hydrolase family 31 protein n=1 Tax=Splendidivirga corallicola TaxID=3051826 RepID=A0ABT8KJY9_9BACT|nr:glycoside hydrolase family 31 protein [Fulvivirgaceae bacterium BMA10]
MVYMDQVLQTPKQVLNKIKNYSRQGSTFYFHSEREVLEIKVISDEIIRFRFVPDGFFQNDFSYALELNHKFTIDRLALAEKPDGYELMTNSLVCVIEKTSMKITMKDMEGKIINEDATGMHWEENISQGGNYVYCSKKIQQDEVFYGLGDKPTDLNLKGKRFTNWGSDTYGFEKERDPLYRNIPFYIGLHHGIGYGIFFDNSFKTYFDFGHEDNEVTSYWADGGEMNYYYIHGPRLMDVTKRYCELTGKHYLPPLWTLGYHQCRWSYYPESTVREITQTFREKQIPCDAIYLDIDYMDGFRCFTWNKDYFPNPSGMIEDLKKEGFKTVVIIDPGIKIDPKYWVYQEGIEQDVFCRRGDGPLMQGPVWPGKCNFPDFTDPKVRKWWGTLFEEFVQIGVDGVWNDMNEPAVFGIDTFPNDVRHDYDGNPCSHRKAHNVYGMQMVRATYEGLLHLQSKKRPFTITRSGYSGVQRYAAVWTGDNVATWEHLQIANTQCQRLSISGISFSGSDIGGFSGDSNGELFTRWIQLGVFSPLFRTHSAGDTADQEPWSYGENYEKIIKKFIELRYELLPYIYTSFWQCTIDGTPILRPLVFMDQDDVDTYERQEEFGFGDKLLVSPVSKPRSEGKEVYLPKGNWYYYFSDELFEGGQEVSIATPLDEMPLFVKSGSVIPHNPVMQYVGEKELDKLTLHIYYDLVHEVSELYEDHGDNFAYQQGIFSLKQFEFIGSKKLITLKQSKTGQYNTYYRDYEMIFHGIQADEIELSTSETKIKKLSKTKGGTFRALVNKEFSKLTIRFLEKSKNKNIK